MRTRSLVLTLCLTMVIVTGCAQSLPSASPASGAPKAVASAGGDPQRGRRLLAEKGCIACHTARGVPEATGSIGPTLTGAASKDRIADAVPNTRENMQRWLMNPPAVKPGTTMPQLGVTEKDAEDLIAFLNTLK